MVLSALSAVPLSTDFIDTDYLSSQLSGYLPVKLSALTIGSRNSTVPIGVNSVGFGIANVALGRGAFAQGNGVSAVVNYAHAEGTKTFAAAMAAGPDTPSTSHAEGWYSASLGAVSHADGCFCETFAFGSYALGYQARTIETDLYAYVWQGIGRLPPVIPIPTENYYNSHGYGTYNINPVNGISGFYIGEENLPQILSSFNNDKFSALKTTVSEMYDSFDEENATIGEIRQNFKLLLAKMLEVL